MLIDGMPPPELEAERLGMRTAAATEYPARVKTLLAWLAPGWTVRVLYSRGPAEIAHNVDGRRVRQWVTVHAVSARLRHAGGLAGAGVWHDGKFVDAWVWTICADPTCGHTAPDHPGQPPQRVPLATLLAMVTVPAVPKSQKTAA
jgi:hypothetical protein